MSTIAVVGRVNNGKSSLVNALHEHVNLLPTDMNICTHALTFICHGEKEIAHIYNQNLKVKPVDFTELKRLQQEAKDIRRIIVYKDHHLLKETQHVFIDTPGFDVENKLDSKVLNAGIEQADAVIFVTADKELHLVESKLLETIILQKKPVLVLFNKADLILDQFDSDEEGLRELNQLTTRIAESTSRISGKHPIKVFALSVNELLKSKLGKKRAHRRGQSTYQNSLSRINDTAQRNLLIWFGNISSPYRSLTVSDPTDFIHQTLKKFAFFDEKIELLDAKKLEKSIYAEYHNYCGISIEVHSNACYIVCILQNIDNEFQFRVAIVFNEIAYLEVNTALINGFEKLGLEANTQDGYIEGFKIKPFDLANPKLIAMEISDDIEKIFRWEDIDK
jgi:GTPase Era involved in 16S rRNA processing